MATQFPTIDTDKLVEALRDAAYIAVGLGVLAFQKAQEAAKDMSEQFTARYDLNKTQADELKARLDKVFSELDERIGTLEAKWDELVEGLEGKLPEQAGAILGQAHDLAKSARKQVRDLLRSAA